MARASRAIPKSLNPVTDQTLQQPSNDEVLIQEVGTMNQQIAKIQMMNKQIIEQQNQIYGREEERRSFLEVDQCIQQLRKQMKDKDEVLRKLKQEVTTLQEHMDQLILMPQTRFGNKEVRGVFNDTQCFSDRTRTGASDTDRNGISNKDKHGGSISNKRRGYVSEKKKGFATDTDSILEEKSDSLSYRSVRDVVNGDFDVSNASVDSITFYEGVCNSKSQHLDEISNIDADTDIYLGDSEAHPCTRGVGNMSCSPTTVNILNKDQSGKTVYSNIPIARRGGVKGNGWDQPTAKGISTQHNNITGKSIEPPSNSTKVISGDKQYVQDEYIPVHNVYIDEDDVSNQPPVDTWFDVADIEMRTGGGEPCSPGPNTVLCLDVSESMVGENFNTMTSLAKTIIESISQEAPTKNMQENIAITIFGHETRIIRHLTNDYNKLLLDLDGLRPGGRTPMAGGLVMAMAACFAARGRTIVGNFEVRPRIILLTDGKATPDGNSTSDFLSPCIDDIRISEIKVSLGRVCEKISRNGARVFWVPIGEDASSVFTDFITSKTCGKKIDATQPSGMNTLVSWTKLNCVALSTDSEHPKVRTLLPSELQNICFEQRMTCSVDDCSDVIECALESHILLPGTRVKAGPEWPWGIDDIGTIGTVVGNDNTGRFYVDWDDGTLNDYQYNRDKKEIDVTDEHRVRRSDEPIATGCRVQRGKSWPGGDEDGGPGSVGSVYEVYYNEEGAITLCLVQWPNGNQGNYRFGLDGCFDIEICQPDETDEERSLKKKMKESKDLKKSIYVTRQNFMIS